MSSNPDDEQRSNPGGRVARSAGEATESIGELVEAIEGTQHHGESSGEHGGSSEHETPTDEHPAAATPAGEVLREVGEDVQQGARAVQSGADLYNDIRRANVHDAASGAHAVGDVSQHLGGVSQGVGHVLGRDGALGRVLGEDATRTIGDVTRVTGAAANVVHRVSEVVENIAELVGGSRRTLPEVEAEFEIHGIDARWRVREARVTEALNEPYAAVVEALTQDDVPTSRVPGKGARLSLRRDALTRLVPGVVSRVDDLGTIDHKRALRFTVVPRLWLLSLRRDCRIFQDRSAKEIVRDVLNDSGAYPTSSGQSWERVQRSYLARECCVQYQESDLAFVSRLLEEEGIGYSFEFDEERGEKIVFFDALNGAPAAALMNRDPVAVRGAESRTASVESIRHFDWTDRLQPTAVMLRDYDFTRPDAVGVMTVTHPSGDPGERVVYDYPGRFTLLDGNRDSRSNHGHAYTQHDGARRAEVRHEELDEAKQRGRGVGNVSNLAPGFKFKITDHGRHDLDEREFVAVRVEHGFRASEATSTEASHGAHEGGARPREEEGYQNTFECVRLDAAWRPARVTPRPVVYGTQTAKVVAPDGEDIYVDTHGRIKVRFHWDHVDDLSDESRSCWIRVAQVWAGAHWGFVFIPRKGMEVVVNFLEGNPDRPLVVGCVYNGTHPTQYPLPEQRTRSYIRTQSTPGDDSSKFNEIRFEDQAGSEEIWIHAQRDFNEVVLHNHGTTVKANQTNTVKKNQTETVSGNQTLSVGGDRSKTVDGDENVTVHGDHWVEIDKYENVHVGGNQQIVVDGPGGAGLSVTGRYNVSASEKIDLTTGTGDTPQAVMVPDRIVLQQGSAKITLENTRIVLESGGGAKLILDGATAMLESHGKSELLLDDNAKLTSTGMVQAARGGSKLTLDANATIQTPGMVKLNP